MLEREAELTGSAASHGDDLGVVALRDQHHAGVIAEVRVAQFGMAVEAEAAPDQRIEVLGKEVGEVERPRLGVVELGEQFAPGKELIAVRARQADHVRVVGQVCVERPARAAVGVAEQHLPRRVSGR